MKDYSVMIHIVNFGTKKNIQKKNSYMRKVEIEIPDGKMAKWVNGVLTLVDEKPQNVMERIKTFDDALAELRDRAEHGDEEAEVLVNEYDNVYSICIKCSKDLLAYLKLRIITYALNEGWKPQYTDGERRWYFWYDLIKKEKYDKLSAEEKSRVVSRGSVNEGAYYGLVYAHSNYTSFGMGTLYGSRLILKSEELAEYAGKQFVEIYEDFCFI